jgi:hypothetical protein
MVAPSASICPKVHSVVALVQVQAQVQVQVQVKVLQRSATTRWLIRQRQSSPVQRCQPDCSSGHSPWAQRLAGSAMANGLPLLEALAQDATTEVDLPGLGLHLQPLHP